MAQYLKFKEQFRGLPGNELLGNCWQFKSRVVPDDNIRYLHSISSRCHRNLNAPLYVERLVDFCSFHWLPRLHDLVFKFVFQAVKTFFGVG